MLFTRNARGIAETFERHEATVAEPRLPLTRQQHLCYFLLSSRHSYLADPPRNILPLVRPFFPL
jgi:hypothetical protein